MKKQLLCTSAIALGIVATPAAAQDWNLDWGGFFRYHVGIGDISTPGLVGFDAASEGINVLQNSEIIFTPSVTLDNGLTFGVQIQLEGEVGGSDIDESFITISSDTFGQLTLGSENSAGSLLMTAAPEVGGMFVNSPSTSAFVPFSAVGLNTAPTVAGIPVGFGFRQAALSSFTEVAGNNDVNRITYYTPDFNGLTVGVSYAPTGATNVGSPFAANKNTVVSDIFDIGVNYSGSFGTTDLTLSARWGQGDAPSIFGQSDPETWGIGASVTFGAITVGGSYAENDNGLIGGLGDQEGWTLGIAYDAAGPWNFGLMTAQGEVDGIGGVTGLEREAYKLQANRTLGPGVNWDVYILYEERDVTGTAFTDVSGTILGTGINLAF